MRAVIITVHGTFAGATSEGNPYWWHSDGDLSKRLRARLGDNNVDIEPFIWRDGQDTGPNRESIRRSAGLELYQRLLKLEASKTPYHLIGHSHGGSVIWHALKRSAAKNQPLTHLQSWTTVSTPFLDFGPDWSGWRRLAGALTAFAALYWIGFWDLLPNLIAGAREGGLAGMIAKLPLAQEYSDIAAALGESNFRIFIGALIAAAIFFGVMLALPVKDVVWFYVTSPNIYRLEQRAAQWYAPLWLGLSHPQDEAINGLKATLVRAPNLVLRRRPGVLGLFLRIFGLAATAVDQFAWSVLMRRAQGCDLSGVALHRAGATPRTIPDGLTALPDEIANQIIARADQAAAGVLARFRSRLETLSDQSDVAALTGILSGDYDDASLVHTTMFDAPWLCDAIIQRLNGAAPATASTAIQTARARLATPTYALASVKAVLAIGTVVVATVAIIAAYRLYVYQETNLASAERIVARFDDSSFNAIDNGEAAGEALVRAMRLGLPLDRTFGAATKLREPQVKSQAYQLIAHELARSGHADVMVPWVTQAASPADGMRPYRQVDHLVPELLAALDAMAHSGREPDQTMATLYQAAVTYAQHSLNGPHQKRILSRLIPAAIALKQWDSVIAWSAAAFEVDGDCNTWDRTVIESARLVRDTAGVDAINRIISACKPSPAAKAEDKQRLLRRLTVAGLPNCTLAEPLLRQSSFHRVGPDAPVPPRFLECLATSGRVGDAESLADAASNTIKVDAPDTNAAALWQTSQTLKKIGLDVAAARWAEIAIRAADQPAQIASKQNDTARTFANDLLKLEILESIDPQRRVSFLHDLSEAGKEFSDPENPQRIVSRGYAASWAKARDINARYPKRDDACVVSAEHVGTLLPIIQISEYYLDKNPSSLILGALRINERCKMTFDDNNFERALSIVSANSNAAVRADNIAKLAPFSATLRQALETADRAYLPAAILKGYVAAVDRLRPSMRPTSRSAFVPVEYVPVTANVPN